jgi:hypothetical protein
MDAMTMAMKAALSLVFMESLLIKQYRSGISRPDHQHAADFFHYVGTRDFSFQFR